MFNWWIGHTESEYVISGFLFTYVKYGKSSPIFNFSFLTVIPVRMLKISNAQFVCLAPWSAMLHCTSDN